MTYGIIGAMDSELAALLQAMDNRREEKTAAATVYTGRLCGCDVAVVKCGVGKVCAALCAQLLIDRFHVDCLINTGVAGGVASGLSVGDMVIATGAVQHDFDIRAFGHAVGYLPAAGGDDQTASVFATDSSLSDRLFAAAAARGQADGFAVHRGLVATGDVFVSGLDLKAALQRQFQATVAEMEGGAIAQVAMLNRVPVALMRAVSDLADGSAPDSFDRFELQTAARSAAVLMDMLAHE